MRTAQLMAGVLLTAVMAAAQAPVPRPAPEFSINLPDGSKLPIKKYRGKTVVLTFISTSCSHCQQFTQVLNQVQKSYAAQGVQVLMCAMDENGKAALPEYIRRFQPAYPMGWNDQVSVLNFLGVSVMTPGFVPKILFIDRQGIIRSQHFGEDPFFKTQDQSVRNALDEMLKARPQGKSAKPKSKT